MRVGATWIAAALIGAAVAGWTRLENGRARAAFAVFSGGEGSAIVLPREAIEAERRAAELLRTTLAQASGLPASQFPIVSEDEARARTGIFVGATRRGGAFLRRPPAPPYDTAVGSRALGEALILRSERRESCEAAASWFLESQLGARWFMPGPLGEVVPRRTSLAVAGEQVVRPGFVSRDLGLEGTAENRAWYARNRLERRFEHSHNLGAIFRPEDLRRDPRMAPMRDGRRYFPPPGSESWQPDLTAPAAIEHAAKVASRAFAADPRRLSFSLSENDSERFDDSPATLAAVSPPRFFRTRPDYSDVVFGFANAVAGRVRPVHPDRWLPTYAYYWAENTPRFPVAPNVVPYLTADRSQWFDPAFAEEDRRLIERWTCSGAEIVAVYDYFYGAPFLIPRPLLTTVSASIPFEHRAGVRAFYAETMPHWALDGPKPWLAAQLLWAPNGDPAALLETYYREFWGEAAPAMREFFAGCERAWLDQPPPGYWIKYFLDDHQALLFPPDVRAALRGHLQAAESLAATPVVAARVAFVKAGFGVTEAFVEFCAARDELSRQAVGGESLALREAWVRFTRARVAFLTVNRQVRSDQPLALAPQKIDAYLRNDPVARVAPRFLDTEAGRAFLSEHPELLPEGATVADLARLFTDARERLADADWAALTPRPIGGSADAAWVRAGGAWSASGEPAEHRRISWQARPAGGRILRLEGCRQEFIVQWLPAKDGQLFLARVRVRARVSPGNQTFLILNFLDDKQRHLGAGWIDRVPVGTETQELELAVIARAPAGTRYVGLGLRAIHQVNQDFADFEGASLRRLDRE